jgi:hypothetical protein
LEKWEKNREALKRFFPDLEKKIAETAPEKLDIESSGSGEPTARLDGRYLHSARDPAREARRLAAAAGGEGADTAFALLGFGLGYMAEALAALYPSSILIIVEKRLSILRAAFECRDLGALFAKRLVFALGDNPDAVSAALLAAAPKKIKRVHSPALQGADGDFYREVERRIENWRSKDAVNEATLLRFGKRWVKNQAANLAAIRELPGVAELAGQFDFPVLLLAAGPSLNELAGKTAALRERCVVVAVDTALRFLQQERAPPDFAISVDPQYWNTRHLDRCLPEDTVLVAESAVYPAALRGRSPRRTFLCGSLYPLGGFIEARTGAKGRLGAGGSVASSAWDFAAALVSRAASPAMFIAGLDFAFPGFQTHYKGALFEEIALITAGRFSPAEDKSFHALRDAAPFFAVAADGGRVLTDRRLSLYASWFESRLLNLSGFRCARLSGRALAIKGMDTTGIEDVLALPPRRAEITRRTEEVLDGVFQKWDAGDAPRVRAERYDAAYSALLGGLEAAARLARSVLSEISAFERSNRSGGGRGGRGEDALVRKISALNDALLQSDVKAIAGFLFPPYRGAPPDSFSRYLEVTREIYSELSNCLDFILSQL